MCEFRRASSRPTVGSDGQRTEEPQPEGVSGGQPADREDGAGHVPCGHPEATPATSGHRCGRGVAGYQVSGKTGTAQQVDPACKCYSNSNYWITFAGIAPADNPRYVIGIMLDAPTRSADGGGGQSAAPLFHNIASWMLQRDSVPLSADPGPKLVLQAD